MKHMHLPSTNTYHVNILTERSFGYSVQFQSRMSQKCVNCLVLLGSSKILRWHFLLLFLGTIVETGACQDAKPPFSKGTGVQASWKEQHPANSLQLLYSNIYKVNWN